MYSGQGIIVGLNQYSHDASCCIVDAETGAILIALEKERFSRLRHDGGPTGECLREALSALDLDETDIRLVVANNHHFRIKPFEQRLPWAVHSSRGGTYSSEYLERWNLIPDVTKIELSHHLAHAWSMFPMWQDLDQDRKCAVVVMDGMGESYREMKSGLEEDPESYNADMDSQSKRREYPPELHTSTSKIGYREAETVYVPDPMASTWRQSDSVTSFRSSIKVLTVRVSFFLFVSRFHVLGNGKVTMHLQTLDSGKVTPRALQSWI